MSAVATGRRPDLHLIGTVALGGALGSLGRWAMGLAMPHASGGIPWGTFTVNITGAFAMGLLVAFLVDRPGVHRLARPFVGIGLLGGWTTFSSLAVETVQLGETQHVQEAIGYVGGTFLFGVLAVGAALWLGQRVFPGP